VQLGTQVISMIEKYLLCMENVLCAAVGTQVISMIEKYLLCMDNVLCAAVGTASYQHGLDLCTVYEECTVCSCRYASYQHD
jgi:hypothetical protein